MPTQKLKLTYQYCWFFYQMTFSHIFYLLCPKQMINWFFGHLPHISKHGSASLYIQRDLIFPKTQKILFPFATIKHFIIKCHILNFFLTIICHIFHMLPLFFSHRNQFSVSLCVALFLYFKISLQKVLVAFNPIYCSWSSQTDIVFLEFSWEKHSEQQQ